MTLSPVGRAIVLLGQHRPDLAEQELRAAIAASPDDGQLHALLAFCLIDLGKHSGAVAESGTAVRLLPDDRFTHYALANAYVASGDITRAAGAAQESLRLDPSDPDTLALLALIRLDETKTGEADALVHQALAIDPQHGNALRALAFVLVRQGRMREAAAIATGALADAPEDAERHATLGSTLLHAGRADDALLALREALRLDPEHPGARAGLLMALKARRGPYGRLLRLFLWESRLSGRKQWLLSLGLFPATIFVWSLLWQLSETLGLVLFPVVIGVFLVVLLTWIGEPLSDLTIRLHPLGRHALSNSERLAADLVGICALGTVAGIGLWAVTRNGAFGLMALFSGMLMLPVSAVFTCPPGWRRYLMAGYTAALAGCAVLAVGFLALNSPVGKNVSSTDPRILFSLLFLFGWKFSSWIGTVLRIGAHA